MKQRSKISQSASNIKSNKCHGISVGMKSRGRPASAREWFECQNQKRNEEAWKYDQLVAAVDNMKKIQWQAKVYTSLAERKSRELEYQKEEEERELKAKEEERVRKQMAEDEMRLEREREEKKAAEKTVPRNVTHPEIDILRKRLDDLKRQNEEERKKMAEKLSYESWRQDNPDVRQMESDRLNRFIREAWIDQKQWKEDERKALEEERGRSEMEAEERRRKEEEEERKREEKRKEQQLEWKTRLEEQIHQLKKREVEEEEIRKKEVILEKERLRLQELIQKRERIKDERKRKNLELFWARQYQLKLKQKAADILLELDEDEKIVEDLLRGLEKDAPSSDHIEFEKNEGEWMLNVLEEQRKLEKLREKEYDLLFSEEAQRMWLKRQSDWQREQRARDKLVEEVMQGLEKQVSEKLASTKRGLDMRQKERDDLVFAIEDTQKKMEEKENEKRKEEEKKLKDKRIREKPSHHESEKQLQREEMLRNRQIEDHQKEISRLEEEMKKLWQESYVPPKFGRKRVVW